MLQQPPSTPTELCSISERLTDCWDHKQAQSIITWAKGLPDPPPWARAVLCIGRVIRDGKIFSPESSVLLPSSFLFKSPFSQSQAYLFFSPFDSVISRSLSATGNQTNKQKTSTGGIGMIPSHSLVATDFFREKRAVTLHIFGTRQVLNADFPPLGETP